MRIQQEQFERNLEAQRERFEQQQAAAQAAPPPPPEPIAEATASTTEVAAATAEPAPAPEPVYIDDPTMQGANPTAGEGSAMMTIQAPGLQPVIKAGRGKKGYKTSGRPQAGGTGTLLIPNTSS